MQDFVTTQLVVAVRTLEMMSFCIFFLNSDLKENMKNLKKEKKKTLRGTMLSSQNVIPLL